jgi:hypothetical protein
MNHVVQTKKMKVFFSETSIQFDDGMCCVETDVKLSEEPFFRTTELNIVNDNPDIVTEVVSAVIGDELVKHLAN